MIQFKFLYKWMMFSSLHLYRGLRIFVNLFVKFAKMNCIYVTSNKTKVNILKLRCLISTFVMENIGSKYAFTIHKSPVTSFILDFYLFKKCQLYNTCIAR